MIQQAAARGDKQRLQRPRRRMSNTSLEGGLRQPVASADAG